MLTFLGHFQQDQQTSETANDLYTMQQMWCVFMIQNMMPTSQKCWYTESLLSKKYTESYGHGDSVAWDLL